MKLQCVRTMSGKGAGPERFTASLRGLAVDRDDRVVAVGDTEVKIFDREGGLVTRWPTAKAGRSVAVTPDGDLLVGETGQIERFGADGASIGMIRDTPRLGRVTALAVSRRHLLVADASNRRIRRYDLEGTWLGDIGAANNTRGFLIPNGRLDFCVDASGVLHAVNPAKHRVERYTEEGELLGHFGRFGHGDGDFPGCCNPTNVAITPSGQVVVTEKAGPRLKIYDADGRLQTLVGPDPFDPVSKNMDIAVDSRGRIYVADTARLQIAVFELLEVARDRVAEPAAVTQGTSLR